MKIDTIYRRTLLSVFFGISLSAMIFQTTVSNAQVRQADDPNLDQVPRYLRENPPINDNAPLSSVITIDNWDNFNLGVDFAENNIAANLQNPPWYFTAYNINAGHHTENGSTWANVVPNFGVGLSGDPVVAYDSLGNLFYINLYPSGTISGIKVIKSTDNGATWGTAVTGASGNDKCWIACDQTSGPYANNVYVCMTNNGVGSFARSTDHGATFTTTFTPSTQNLPGMSVCVGPNSSTQGGAVYCVTNSGSSFNSTYTFYRSQDGGGTFTLMSTHQFSNTVGSQINGRNSVQGMRTRPYPYIEADNSYGPHRGRLYNVYASNDPPGDGHKPDIWLRYSDDGGATFSSAIRVNDDANTQANHQWHPAIWCDKQTGRIYINWMDTRDTPTSDSAFIYGTFSDDGGVTYAVNQKISNKKMKIDCSSCGGGGDPRYQGDYNGIVSNIKGSMSAWTDFRSGSFMSTAGYLPDFAMAIDHNSDTLFTGNDSIDFIVEIPDVKLYTDTVLLSGELIPIPTGGTVTFLFPQGNMITTYPNSKIVRLKSAGAVPVGSYQAVFTAASPNGTPVHKRSATVKIMNSESIILTVTATPAAVCQGASTQLQANANGGTPPYAYSWTSNPVGFTSTIANPVASPIVNTWYKVTVTDNASHIAIDSVLVTIITAPETPGPISGPADICKDSLATYSVVEVTGATSYSWTVPAGVTIVSGQNTSVISVIWGDNSGNVSVIAGNSCGNSNPSILSVTKDEIPPVPGAISGPASVCKDATIDFSIENVTGATSYSWSVPAGAIIMSGQNTPAISVIWGNTSGTVSVAAGNSCGNSNPSNLAVTENEVPPVPGTITGPASVCTNASIDFSIENVTGATSYLWTVPNDASILTGQGSITIHVQWGASAGDVSVVAQNFCGNGQPGSKSINIEAFPAPAGILSGKDTVCKGQNGYQYSVPDITGADTYIWSVPAGATINGASDQKQILVDFSASAVSGSITVKGHNTCGDGTESSKTVMVNSCTGIQENKTDGNVTIYPNPTEGLLYIAFKSQMKQLDLILADVNGRELIRESLQNIQPGYISQLDVSKVAKGVYFIKLTNNDHLYIEKIVVR